MAVVPLRVLVRRFPTPQGLSRFIYLPRGFTTGVLRKRINNQKLGSMKSHKHNVMIMQQILPTIVYMYTYEPGPWCTILWISNIFKKIFSKLVDTHENTIYTTIQIGDIKHIGIWCPPLFLDVMAHLLIVHSRDEVDACGPVVDPWCYSMERYLSILKGFVGNKARLEGAWARGT